MHKRQQETAALVFGNKTAKGRSWHVENSSFRYLAWGERGPVHTYAVHWDRTQRGTSRRVVVGFEGGSERKQQSEVRHSRLESDLAHLL